jgi:hypothetical protein
MGKPFTFFWALKGNRNTGLQFYSNINHIRDTIIIVAYNNNDETPIEANYKLGWVKIKNNISL